MNKLTQFKVILVATVAATIGGSLWLTERGTTVPEVYPVSLESNADSTLKPHLVYRSLDKIVLSQSEFTCLARNIYHEAGVESLEGKIAVAQVTFNRLNSGRWGKTVCGVVMARGQFSWTLDRRKIAEKPTGKLWDASVAAAQQYLDGARIYNLDRSMHYHTDWIDQPRWAKDILAVKQIGQHIFYHNLR
jgi:spore germination cell wall hydrolase CwlJ-like protein